MRVRRAQPARWQQVPDGMRDLLPAEAERRAALLGVLREEVRRWGYREVETPTLEFLETFLVGAGAGIQDRLFKIVDSRGELLVLRPEMTVPIARLAATRLLQTCRRPLRVAYVAPVFRGQDAGQGRLREFTQAGVELLGDSGADADAEVIALGLECLGRAGVRETLLHVGNLGFLHDVLAGLPDDERDELLVRLYRKEFTGLDGAVSDPAVAQVLRTLPDLHGPDAITRAAVVARTDEGRAALDRLAAIIERLADYGAPGRVTVDLSIIRDFSYYTGIVFEAYGAGAGYPLLGGGRYDGLLERFGLSCPATGFAIGVERVLAAAADAAERAVDFHIILMPQQRSEGLQLARQLRECGKVVVVSIADGAVEPVISDAGVQALSVIRGTGASAQAVTPDGGASARTVIRVDGRYLRVTDTATGRERILDRDELLVEIRGRPRAVAWTH